jgi:hypothetical protein
MNSPGRGRQGQERQEQAPQEQLREERQEQRQASLQAVCARTPRVSQCLWTPEHQHVLPTCTLCSMDVRHC